MDAALVALSRELRQAVVDEGVDVRIALVSGDLGVGSADVAGCTVSGDDGRLLADGCGAVPFEAVRATDTPRDLADRLLCRTHRDDCGFEQPLEAAIKAVSPAGSISFHRGTGRGEELSAEFTREDGIQVLVVVSAENDCSAEDESLFDLSSPSTLPPSLRCHEYPERLYDVRRYVTGLLADRAASDLVYVVAGGVPADIAGGSLARMLDDERMAEVVDPRAPTRLTPSCAGPRAELVPPRRQLELAQRLQAAGVRTIVTSLCGPAPLATAFTGLGAEAVRAARCVPCESP